MSTAYLWINAGLRVPQDKDANQARVELSKLRQATQQEIGCLQFEVKPHNDNPNKFTLWEKWTNQEALNQHFREPHTKNYLSLELTQVEYIEKLGETL